MARGTFNIDTHEVAEHVNRLEQMHRSALPNAIRGTLNGMAFFTKQKSMPIEARRAFVNRDKNFFKAKSRVQTARGWSVDLMRATIGFIGDSQAVEDLEKQEHGGKIDGRAFVPMKTARTGKSNNRKVQKKNRLSNIKNVVSTSDMKGRGSKTAKQRYVKAAFTAVKNYGKSGYVLGNLKRGKRTLSRIDSVYSTRDGRLIIKRTPIYTYTKGRLIRVKAKDFMKRASHEAGLNGNRIFQNEARRQFDRLNR